MLKWLLALTALVAYIYAAPRPLIANGNDANIAQFPYQVSVQLEDSDKLQHFCGGAIIGNEWILTAGHCLIDRPDIEKFKVRAGITNLNETTNMQQRNVVDSIIHPDLEEHLELLYDIALYDIALLRLDEPLIYNDFVQQIDLPSENEKFEGEAVLSGWGSISTSSELIIPNTLQFAVMPLITYKECAKALKKKFGTSELLAETDICTGPTTARLSSCVADSGSPLVQDEKVIGLVAWGPNPCGMKNAPSVYTNVSSLIGFIKQSIQKK